MKRVVIILCLGWLIMNSAGCKKQPETKDITTNSPKIKTQLWESMRSEGWKKIRKIDFVYNDKDQLIQEKFQSIKEDSTFLTSRVLRSYDSTGNLKKVKREQLKDGNWKLTIQSRYLLDSDKIVERTDSIIRENKVSLISAAYNYDDKDRLISEISQKVAENDRTNYLKTIYHYNEQGLVIEKEFPIWANNKWENSRKMTLAYNQQGEHIRTTRFNWKDNIWNTTIHYDLEVDQDGKRLSELWYTFTKDTKKTYMRVTYTYL